MEMTLSGLLPEALFVDHPEVDAQHEQIFIRVELLKDACCDVDYPSIDVFDDLLRFVGHHFATEERIAEQAGLEFSEHAKKHRNSLYLLNKALDRVREDQRNGFDFLRYVEYWLERHILEEDKSFGALIKASAGRAEITAQPSLVPTSRVREGHELTQFLE